MKDYFQIKQNSGVMLSSLIISAFTQAMNDLQQKEIQRKTNSITDGFKKAVERQNLKRNKYLSSQGDFAQNNFRRGANYKFIDAHRLELEELIERYETDIYTGLTEKDAKLRLLKKKKDGFTQITQNTFSKRIMNEMMTPFHLSMLFAALIDFISYQIFGHFQQFVTGVVLLILVSISSIIGQFRQRKGLNIMENLSQLIPKYCLVIREGKEKRILSQNLVAGDIIKLSEGIKCPADIRILASTDLYISQEIYNGSQQEEYVHPECTNRENPLNTKNLIFMGCRVERGKGKGIVISTGADTLLQDLGFKCSSKKYFPDSELKKEFDMFLNVLSILVLIISFVVFIINIIQPSKIHALLHLQFISGMILSGIPLGMVMLKSLYLLIIQKELNREQIDVNYLESIGVLGQTTCICTDMTGTLTLNTPIVSDLWYDDRAHVGKNKQLIGEKEKLQYNIKTESTLQQLMKCAVLCNESNFNDKLSQNIIQGIVDDKNTTFEEKKDNLLKAQQQHQKDLSKQNWIDWPCTGGQQNEAALLKFFQPLQDIRSIRKNYPVAKDFVKNTAKIPFQSSTKFSSLICTNINYSDSPAASNPLEDQDAASNNSYYILYTKGAPSVVWEMCDKVMYKGKVVDKESTWEIKFEKIISLYGERGERVLAFAKLNLPKDDYPEDFEFNMTNANFPLKNQVFLGLISQLDPPDFGSANMVKICKQSGIKVIMLTGEESLTGTKIAQDCNIITHKTQIQLQQQLNISQHSAIQDAQALVIEGQEIEKILAREEGLPEKQKGIILRDYLRKPEVIFTRVQPAHKEQIVKSLQMLGHLVVTTGLGIRDSPALRQAEVGVSFGVQGEQVAKDTSDMILLKGIEKGRTIFDNLKKSLAFCLASTVAQIGAYAFFYSAQIPFALSHLSVILLDLGLIHLPALFYVYLMPETPPMDSKPESAHQINKKMVIYSYFAIGLFPLFAGFFAYFTVLSDFGIHYNDIQGLLGKQIFMPLSGDEYDPSFPWLGNSVLKNLFPCQQSQDKREYLQFADFLFSTNNNFDLRLAFASCQPDGTWKSTFLSEDADYYGCDNHHLSLTSVRPNCYTTEAFKFASTAYIYSSSLVIIALYMAGKTRIQSIFTDRLESLAVPFGIFIQLFTLFLFSLVDLFQDAFLTRKVEFKYYGWFGIPFGIMLIAFEEIRKKLIRKQIGAEEEKKKEQNTELEKQQEEKNQLLLKEECNSEMQDKLSNLVKQNENTWFIRNLLL